MAKLFIASTGSNTSPYDTWAKAATAPASALNLAAAGDDVFWHGESFNAGAAVTITGNGTPTQPVRVICTNDKTSESPAVEASNAVLDLGSGNFTFAMSGSWYFKGITIRAGNGAGAGNIQLCTTDDDILVMENGGLDIPGTGSTSRLQCGALASALNSMVITRNCNITFGAVGQGMNVYCPWYSEGDTYAATGAVPNTLVTALNQSGYLQIRGGDLSALSTTLVLGANTIPARIDVIQSKLHATLNRLSSSSAPGAEVYIVDCDSGDVHYNFEHWNWLGRTEVSTAINVTADGATYDGTNRWSYKITGSSFASYAFPYVSPPIQVFHDGTSAITPYLECLRDGSATAHNDDEVWARMAYKATAGSTRASFVSDKRGQLAAAAAQADGAGLDAWTGESGTAKSYKIGPAASITPAEIGDITAWVYVAGAHTVYVDPKIRGLA